MTKQSEDTIQFRRILVALDTSPHSRAALEAAARLAHTLEAEIQGLFVHDSTWSKASRLPSFAEVREYTGEIRPMPEKEMENQMALIEKRLKIMMERLGKRFEISHFLKSAKGIIEDKVLEAAKEADMITLGRMGHSYSSSKKMGTTAQKIIERSNKPVLILQKGRSLGSSVAVVYDGSIAGQKGLKLALSLVKKNESSLFLHVIRNKPEDLAEQSEEIERLMDEAPVPVYLNFLEQPDIRKICEQVNSTRSGLLILPKNQPIVSTLSIGTLLDYLQCPLLLMDAQDE